MKRIYIILSLCSVFVFIACNEQKKPSPDGSLNANQAASVGDSAMNVQATQNDTNILEDLLAFTSEKSLIDKFGKARIKYDTVWEPEGMFEMGTYLDKGTLNQVQFTWADSASRSGQGSIMISQSFNPDGSTSIKSNWHSKTGIRLGMSAADVQKINGHQFKFSGIGWDYGGTVTDFENGKLEDAGISLTMDADYNVHSGEKDYNSVSGEQDVMSDDPAVSKVGIQVVQIFVFDNKTKSYH